MRKYLILIFCLSCCWPLMAQKYTSDTIIVMHYNTLNYGILGDSSCPGLVTDNKHGYLKKIIKYSNPDILGLVKMKADSMFVTDSVEQWVLNNVCADCYTHVNYTNHSGYRKTNLIYFKKQKFGYLSTQTLYSGDTNITDINLHKLYYKDSVSNTMGDTLFLNLIQYHLLSGDTTDSIRGAEIKRSLDSLYLLGNRSQNILLLGDFNSRTSNEACIQYLIQPKDTTWKFYDPSNQLGDWTDHPKNFAQWLTISTRAIQLSDCGSKGGLDGIYDHIFANYALMKQKKGVIYIPNSYMVLGQDGQHVNKGLLDNPNNNSVPGKVLNSLYYMSNHLPVQLKLAFQQEQVKAGTISAAHSDICKGDSVLLTASGYRGNIVWQKDSNGWREINQKGNNIYVSPVQNTTYRAFVTGNLSSDSSNTLTISMKPLPQVSISPKNPAEFCEGDSILLSVLSFPSVIWNTGDTTRRIYTQQPGIFWVQVRNNYGCSKIDSVTVSTIKKPDASFIYHQNGNLTADFKARDTTLTNYQWDFGDGQKANGKSVTHAFSIRTAWVKLTTMNSKGCYHTDSNFLIWEKIELPPWEQISIHPNPSNGCITISNLSLLPAQTEIEIIDATGKYIYHSSTGVSQQSISMPISPGIYIVRFSSNGFQKSYKFICLMQ